MSDNGGVITEGADGTQTLDVATPANLSEVDKLKGDPAFIERYLAGDKAAIATYGAAIKAGESPALTPVAQAADAPIDATPPDAQQPSAEAFEGQGLHTDEQITLNFGSLAAQLDIPQMQAANKQAAELATRYGLDARQAQATFDRLQFNAQQYGDDALANAEARKDAALNALQREWGDQLDNKLDQLFAVLEKDKALDQLLVETGSWSDPIILSQLLQLSAANG